MPSLVDLAAVYAPPGPEAGFVLADIARQDQEASSGAAFNRERLLRDHRQFNLPGLRGQQASRGAYLSSATQRKESQMATGVGDQLSLVEMGLASTKGRLATDALLAKTGIRLGGV